MSFTTFSGIGLTRHVADQSAVAAINRALRGCCDRSHDPCYFVTVHYRRGNTLKTYKLCFVGFGNIGRALARLLQEKTSELRERYGLILSMQSG